MKSCRGVALQEATLDRRGIVHDREMMIVDANNQQMTQRGTPVLARIATSLTDEALVLRAPGLDELRVPWRLANGEPPRAAREVSVWRDVVMADDVGDEAARWMSAAVGQPCRLVTTGERSHRVRPPERLSTDLHPDTRTRPVEVAFPDGFPLLLVSEESLADLNHRLDLPEALGMDRFRPNLVVAGCNAPYAEDTWKAFQIGTVRLLAGGPCGRCIITTTDQDTLERSREPLRTLAQYRRTVDGEVTFGQNVILTAASGRLRVGDEVRPEC